MVKNGNPILDEYGNEQIREKYNTVSKDNLRGGLMSGMERGKNTIGDLSTRFSPFTQSEESLKSTNNSSTEHHNNNNQNGSTDSASNQNTPPNFDNSNYSTSGGENQAKATSGGHGTKALAVAGATWALSSLFGGNEADASTLPKLASSNPVQQNTDSGGISGMIDNVSNSIAKAFEQAMPNIGNAVAGAFNGLTAYMGMKEISGGANSSIGKTLSGTMDNIGDMFNTKMAGEGMGEFLGKKLPVLGLGLGAAGAYDRASHGDLSGAAMELTSGIASMVPGVGTLGSSAIDSYLLARDNGWIGSSPVASAAALSSRESSTFDNPIFGAIETNRSLENQTNSQAKIATNEQIDQMATMNKSLSAIAKAHSSQV